MYHYSIFCLLSLTLLDGLYARHLILRHDVSSSAGWSHRARSIYISPPFTPRHDIRAAADRGHECTQQWCNTIYQPFDTTYRLPPIGVMPTSSSHYTPNTTSSTSTTSARPPIGVGMAHWMQSGQGRRSIGSKTTYELPPIVSAASDYGCIPSHLFVHSALSSPVLKTFVW